jgi:hypothetical protein
MFRMRRVEGVRRRFRIEEVIMAIRPGWRTFVMRTTLALAFALIWVLASWTVGATAIAAQIMPG